MFWPIFRLIPYIPTAFFFTKQNNKSDLARLYMKEGTLFRLLLARPCFLVHPLFISKFSERFFWGTLNAILFFFYKLFWLHKRAFQVFLSVFQEFPQFFIRTLFPPFFFFCESDLLCLF